ncbi:MAG: glycine cleavage system protein H [Planctomycetota bacterium]|jgi:glycine cleavage system H protein
MAALLAVVTFILFATLDYLISRRRVVEPVAAPAPVPTPAPLLDLRPRGEPVWVAGFELPEDLAYHPGHTWARLVGPDTVAIGLDDFARRLVGQADALEVPAEGSWLRQGAEGFRVDSEGRSAELLSPVDGEVVEVNPEIRRDPSLSTKDPYARGWICKVWSPSLAANLRNLLSGSMARRWMENAREQLELKLMALSGSVLQDGGEPAPDFARHLEPDEWKHLVEGFLLTKVKEK